MIAGPVDLTTIAHGGVCVGRIGGRVVFVRGGIPGERVMLNITDTSKKSYWRGEVIEVLTASADRIIPACAVADRCGGCDYQHISLTRQRELKTQVIAEQLSRLAGVDYEIEVEDVGIPLGWRTRMRYHRGPGGYGLLASRSREVVNLPAKGCLIAHPKGRDLAAFSSDKDTLKVTIADSGIAINGNPKVVTEQVLGREYIVSSEGFWQVHPKAAEVLVTAVLQGLEPKPGETALDLYCGVGLFAGFLTDAGTKVVGIESDKTAIGFARKNIPGAKFRIGDVAKVLQQQKLSADLVVLDPPRSGAGKKVVNELLKIRPRRIAYVACDPAGLARDLKLFLASDYKILEIRAFDLFPMTHHVECVALLARK
ncbi:MAG: tRNA/tmRNA/rRNA uracil-C5-methylase [Propionibacterium sp.]|nr:MAG: tRNA/tmRNA/rRNA uracil-C5-methylase [Propionibacterium sp.]